MFLPPLHRYSTGSTDFKTVNALYPRGHQYPFTKQLTLSCQQLPITAAFDFIDDNSHSITFAQYEIRHPESGDAQELLSKNPIKLRVRADQNGIVQIYSAVVQYEKLESVPMDQSNADGEKMETDESATPPENAAGAENNAEASAEEPKRKSKPKMVTVELDVIPHFVAGKYSRDEIAKHCELESNLILADKNWKEKTDAKNALEEFIYEWRDRLESGSYDSFVHPEHKGPFQAKLEANEKWLYEQEEEDRMHSKSVYDERTDEMKAAYADGILTRKREFENRPRALEQLGGRLQMSRKLIESSTGDSTEEKEEVDKFTKEVDEKQRWFDDAMGKLNTMSTYDDPPIKVDAIAQQTAAVEASMQRLNSSRARRQEQKRKAEADAAKKAADAAAAAAAASEAEKKKSTDKGQPVVDGEEMPSAQNGSEKMDIDGGAMDGGETATTA